ncbi:MAG TPA: response regulator transcription factor [Polyangiaceae bacterium]|jgi:DNA-binding response OmpR family regulator
MNANKPQSGPSRRVLVIEDDESIMLGLRINLQTEGYTVLEADDGAKGLAMARADRPDVVILDVMLPTMNGFQVLQAIRREGLPMPIILLSARTGEMDKVTGLELGAEDYVAKPFSLAELLARVRAALRRGPRPVESSQLVHVFGDTRVDIAARTVTRLDVAVDMTATEFDLLLCLIEARGVALSRDAIFTRVWGPNHHGTPRTIDNFIQQLRAKLEPEPQRPRHLITVRGIGYRFDG